MRISSSLMINLLSAMMAVALLYAPQPLLPVLSQALAVDKAQISLLVSAALMPMALAPLVYGLLLENIPANRLLFIGITATGLSTLALAWCESFYPVLILRFITGLSLPLVLTSVMTYLSRTAKVAGLQQTFAAYIAATVVGGLLGRLVAGITESLFGWQMSFVVLGVLCLSLILAVKRLPDDIETMMQPLDSRKLSQTLSKPAFLLRCILLFMAFFVFAGIMNFLPFRLQEIQPQASSLSIASIYAGYLFGIFTALLAPRLSALAGDKTTLIAGILSMILALVLLFGSALILIYVAMALICLGMFLVNAQISASLNRIGNYAGISNALYIAFYYAGGVFGSWLPGMIYQSTGWAIMLGICLSILFTVLIGLSVGIKSENH